MGEGKILKGVINLANCCGNNSREVTLKVEGMSCGHCKMAVEKALDSLDGVQKVEVDVEQGEVKVEFDSGKTDEKDIKDSITEEGYSVI